VLKLTTHNDSVTEENNFYHTIIVAKKLSEMRH